MFIYAVRDIKTAGFGNPMFFQADGQCIRSVADEVNGVNGSEPTILRNHPEDFEVFRIGEYDTDNGVIKSEVVSLLPCVNLKSNGR